jgi:hypothetical protein
MSLATQLKIPGGSRALIKGKALTIYSTQVTSRYKESNDHNCAKMEELF